MTGLTYFYGEHHKKMKAKQDFVVHISTDTGSPVSYKEGEPIKGIKKLEIKKGKEVPGEIERYIFLFNKDFLDLEYKDGVPQNVPEDFKQLTPPPIIPKRKYTEEGLNKVYEKSGLEGLKKIGAKFDPPITDRSYKRLITEILIAQEKLLGVK